MIGNAQNLMGMNQKRKSFLDRRNTHMKFMATDREKAAQSNLIAEHGNQIGTVVMFGNGVIPFDDNDDYIDMDRGHMDLQASGNLDEMQMIQRDLMAQRRQIKNQSNLDNLTRSMQNVKFQDDKKYMGRIGPATTTPGPVKDRA